MLPGKQDHLAISQRGNLRPKVTRGVWGGAETTTEISRLQRFFPFFGSSACRENQGTFGPDMVPGCGSGAVGQSSALQASKALFHMDTPETAAEWGVKSRGRTEKGGESHQSLRQEWPPSREPLILNSLGGLGGPSPPWWPPQA